MNSERTIQSVIEDDLCIGCGTCVALCPNDAVEMLIDEKKGVYVPELDRGKCNNCGICLKVCPGHEIDFKGLNLEIFGKEPENILIGNYINCYAGHATDHDIRYNSASGGIVTALLIFALERGLINGALVTRMKRDKPLEPEPFIARTKEEIIEASKSKYCPVPANVALRGILDADADERFAVVGLPCHIHGIRKAEQINKKLKEKIVLHFGIFCVTTATFLGTEFLLQEIGVTEEQIKRLDYRGEGWPGNMQIRLKNGEKKSFRFCAIWNGKTVGNIVLSFHPLRCSLCIDGGCELADISFADAWIEQFKNDKVGRSFIVSRNEAGVKLLQKAISSKKIETKEMDANKIIQSQGMLTFKKNRLAAFIFLFKILGKNVPSYNQRQSESRMATYLMVMLSYLWTRVTSNRRLWWLPRMYFSIKYNKWWK